MEKQELNLLWLVYVPANLGGRVFYLVVFHMIASGVVWGLLFSLHLKCKYTDTSLMVNLQFIVTVLPLLFWDVPHQTTS